MALDQLVVTDQSAVVTDQPTADGDLAVIAGDGLVIRAADAAVPDLPPGSGTAAALRVAIVPTVAPPPSGATVPGSAVQRWAGPRLLSLAPEAVATAWLSALLVRRDWTTLWSTTDANLRLAAAQEWLAGLDRIGDNVTAWSLAAEVPHLGMWGPFAEHQFTCWADALGPDPSRTGDGLGVQGPSDRHQFEAVGQVEARRSSRYRSDVGRELCVVELDAGPAGRSLTLRLRDRWRVAGLGRGVLQPGWPVRRIDLEEGDRGAA